MDRPHLLVIASAIFPAYYNTITAADGSSTIEVFGISIENTAAYSINLGLAFGIVAVDVRQDDPENRE